MIRIGKYKSEDTNRKIRIENIQVIRIQIGEFTSDKYKSGNTYQENTKQVIHIGKHDSENINREIQVETKS